MQEIFAVTALAGKDEFEAHFRFEAGISKYHPFIFAWSVMASAYPGGRRIVRALHYKRFMFHMSRI